MANLIFISTAVVAAFMLAGFLKMCLAIVRHQSANVVERLGKYSRTLGPGLHFMVPILDRVVAQQDLRVHEVTSKIDVKTKDDAFITLPVSLMTQVDASNASKAHYALSGKTSQGVHPAVTTVALNALRGVAAGMMLQELYSDRDSMAREVMERTKERLADYGYELVGVLVEQPEVGETMRQAFNAVIESRREREAAEQRAEAKRTMIVGEARAESEAQTLRAQGIASARRVLSEGFSAAVQAAAEHGVSAEDVSTLLLETNRLDAIRAASESGSLVLMDLRGGAASANITLPSTMVPHKN